MATQVTASQLAALFAWEIEEIPTLTGRAIVLGEHPDGKDRARWAGEDGTAWGVGSHTLVCEGGDLDAAAARASARSARYA